MDYQYTFRQAHQDRLEDAGVVRYRPSDGFRVLKAKDAGQRIPVRRLRPVFAAIVSMFTK